MTPSRGLPPELTIYTAGDVRTQCLAWMGAPAEEGDDDGWALDASAVDQVDAAGVQLLVALARSLDGLSRPLRLVQPSAPLTDACAALGLGDWLSTRTAPGATA